MQKRKTGQPHRGWKAAARNRHRKQPVRVQRKRVKGWRMPADTIYVGRGTKWGNPFTVSDAREIGYRNPQEAAAMAYEKWLAGNSDYQPSAFAAQRLLILADLMKLQGVDLACWCAPGAPCHGDVLLKMANQPTADPSRPA